MEDDFHTAAELQQANLCQIFVDGKRLCDVFGKAKHLLVPVAIVRISHYDTCRLVKH